MQEAFLNLLGEQNELVQELASQGMSIVYELGDSSMKTNLVNALVGTLTGSGKKKRAIKVSQCFDLCICCPFPFSFPNVLLFLFLVV